jgi:hypothetical protein
MSYLSAYVFWNLESEIWNLKSIYVSKPKKGAFAYRANAPFYDFCAAKENVICWDR